MSDGNDRQQSRKGRIELFATILISIGAGLLALGGDEAAARLEVAETFFAAPDPFDEEQLVGLAAADATCA